MKIQLNGNNGSNSKVYEHIVNALYRNKFFCKIIKRKEKELLVMMCEVKDQDITL